MSVTTPKAICACESTLALLSLDVFLNLGQSPMHTTAVRSIPSMNQMLRRQPLPILNPEAGCFVPVVYFTYFIFLTEG